MLLEGGGYPAAIAVAVAADVMPLASGFPHKRLPKASCPSPPPHMPTCHPALPLSACSQCLLHDYGQELRSIPDGVPAAPAPTASAAAQAAAPRLECHTRQVQGNFALPPQQPCFASGTTTPLHAARVHFPAIHPLCCDARRDPADTTRSRRLHRRVGDGGCVWRPVHVPLPPPHPTPPYLCASRSAPLGAGAGRHGQTRRRPGASSTCPSTHTATPRTTTGCCGAWQDPPPPRPPSMHGRQPVHRPHLTECMCVFAGRPQCPGLRTCRRHATTSFSHKRCMQAHDR